MKKIFFFTFLFVLATLVACRKDSSKEPSSGNGGGDKPQPEWTKSDNFILVQLAMASNTLGCTVSDIAAFEEDGWMVSSNLIYLHLEKTIENVDVVMNCYLNGDTVFHTTCSMSSLVPGTLLANLSYAKAAVETLTSQFVMTTSEVCDFRLMSYKEISEDKNKHVTSFDEALALIDKEDYSYTIFWTDYASTNYEELSDGIWFGSMSGLNLGILKSPGNDCIVSIDITSKQYQ
ncbi:MAG: hypothetical protein MJ002_04415 [Paludibacteraceae bacterium]|nr:hypothetical protein [Paludibacteraceae bacterium]